ncbi:hypothetical protein ACVWZA_000254 [Sphingomonas sp. UYAg733]
MDKKLWGRIGLIATVCLVPGGMIIGATIAARRMKRQADLKATETEVGPVEPEAESGE